MKLNINQQLKERLVGMAVLFLFAIIVIPWILDGERPDALNSDNAKSDQLKLPSPNSLKTHDINLQDGAVKVVSINPPKRIEDITANTKGLNNSEVNSTTQALEVSPSNAGLTISTEILTKTPSVSDEHNDVMETSVSDPDEQGTRTSQQEQVNIDPVSTWSVQIGSFGDKNNAERQVRSLADKGFPAFISRFQNGSGQVLFRVRVGTEKDRARADKLQARLAKSGFTGKVLTHP